MVDTKNRDNMPILMTPYLHLLLVSNRESFYLSLLSIASPYYRVHPSLGVIFPGVIADEITLGEKGFEPDQQPALNWKSGTNLRHQF